MGISEIKNTIANKLKKSTNTASKNSSAEKKTIILKSVGQNYESLQIFINKILSQQQTTTPDGSTYIINTLLISPEIKPFLSALTNAHLTGVVTLQDGDFEKLQTLMASLDTKSVRLVKVSEAEQTLSLLDIFINGLKGFIDKDKTLDKTHFNEWIDLFSEKANEIKNTYNNWASSITPEQYAIYMDKSVSAKIMEQVKDFNKTLTYFESGIRKLRSAYSENSFESFAKFHDSQSVLKFNDINNANLFNYEYLLLKLSSITNVFSSPAFPIEKDIYNELKEIFSGVKFESKPKEVPIPETFFSDLTYNIVAKLENSETYQQLLAQNSNASAQQLLEIAQITAESIMNTLNENDLSFAFNLNFELDETYQQPQNSICFAKYSSNSYKPTATITLYKSALEKTAAQNDSPLYSAASIIQAIMHEFGHAIDSATEFTSNSSKPENFSETKLLALAGIFPAIKSFIEAFADKYKSKVSNPLQELSFQLNSYNYYKRNNEVFARKFGALSTSAIIEKLKRKLPSEAHEKFKDVTGEKIKLMALHTPNLAMIENEEICEEFNSLLLSGFKKVHNPSVLNLFLESPYNPEKNQHVIHELFLHAYEYGKTYINNLPQEEFETFISDSLKLCCTNVLDLASKCAKEKRKSPFNISNEDLAQYYINAAKHIDDVVYYKRLHTDSLYEKITSSHPSTKQQFMEVFDALVQSQNLEAIYSFLADEQNYPSFIVQRLKDLFHELPVEKRKSWVYCSLIDKITENNVLMVSLLNELGSEQEKYKDILKQYSKSQNTTATDIVPYEK